MSAYELFGNLTPENKAIVAKAIDDMLEKQAERGVSNYGKSISIYAVRCVENGKVYVGRTQDVERRIRQHLGDLKGGRKKQSINRVLVETDWQKDFNTYGWDSFEVYILETDIAEDDADAREEFWIEEYRATDSRYGYNRTISPSAAKVQITQGLPPNLSKGEVGAE